MAEEVLFSRVSAMLAIYTKLMKIFFSTNLTNLTNLTEEV